jgi:hypothetical protein
LEGEKGKLRKRKKTDDWKEEEEEEGIHPFIWTLEDITNGCII